ncbi:MAG TPA: DUF6677 family protein [Blastocatellia bacterium]|nr:DUF6677 family protein [Blastocatellia bacterium]
MQSRDGLTDDITPQYRDRTIPEDLPVAFSAGRRALAIAAAWLIPGAGHLTLGRFGRGLMFFVLIVGSFALGLALEGRLYWPTVSDPPSMFHFDLISVLWTFAQIGSGLCYLVSYAMGWGTNPLPAATNEYGNTFMFLAGLLNYLIIHDAYDIAAGRKR